MNAEDIYQIWAPSGSVWSRWATPALFAQMQRPMPFDQRMDNPILKTNLEWIPNSETQTAMVIDLPGSESVWMAAAFAQRGYRPVPIINACNNWAAIVDMEAILLAIYAMTPVLKAVTMPDGAPPVFFLDAQRMTGFPLPATFDNRWIVFAQDFPSGNFLASQGVKAVQLVQKANGQPQTDLAHVLLRWQESGLPISVKATNGQGPAQALIVTKPPRYKKLWYRALALLGLRRHSAGGFGDIVPDPNESRGFG